MQIKRLIILLAILISISVMMGQVNFLPQLGNVRTVSMGGIYTSTATGAEAILWFGIF